MEATAGGVVYRKTNNQVEILFIFDRFDHISLPKGHLEGNETPKEAALREIEEETGIRGTIMGDCLGVVRFPFKRDGHVLEKEVTYYLVEAAAGTAAPQMEEIRGLQWFGVEEALRMQRERGYANNDRIVALALARLAEIGNRL
ncbi:MAG: hydrolase [Bacilli bacterium]|nr:hydrolase [Bacilli bacterium]